MKKGKLMQVEGYDGNVEITASVRLTATRFEKRSIRCRPGTFEWRYGRENADAAIYHAGCHFAQLWERAGTASASSPDLEQVGGGQWKGLPNSRAIAMSEIKNARLAMGKWATARLVDYCVMGTPIGDMATKYNVDQRGMAFVLAEDLKACAEHFRFL